MPLLINRKQSKIVGRLAEAGTSIRQLENCYGFTIASFFSGPAGWMNEGPSRAGGETARGLYLEADRIFMISRTLTYAFKTCGKQ